MRISKPVATALLAGGGFAAGLLIYADGDPDAWLVALPVGATFALTTWFSLHREARKAAARRAQFAHETIIKDGAAMYVDGPHRTRGWLYLTDQRLVFEPFERGRDVLRLDVPAGEVDARNAAGVLGRRKLEIAARGKTQRYFVQEREVWVVMIQHAAARQATGKELA